MNSEEQILSMLHERETCFLYDDCGECPLQNGCVLAFEFENEEF